MSRAGSGPAGGESLIRAIGTLGLAAGVINITIGGGIFRLPALVAASLGPAAPLAYLVCAVAVSLIVFCIADAGSRVSLTGGPYAYVAKITSISGREIGVKYLDDASEETRDRSEVRKLDWKIGARLECRWKRGDTYFPGTVRRIGDREVHFDYDDGDKEATEIAMCRERTS